MKMDGWGGGGASRRGYVNGGGMGGGGVADQDELGDEGGGVDCEADERVGDRPVDVGQVLCVMKDSYLNFMGVGDRPVDVGQVLPDTRPAAVFNCMKTALFSIASLSPYERVGDRPVDVGQVLSPPGACRGCGGGGGGGGGRPSRRREGTGRQADELGFQTAVELACGETSH